MTIPFLRRGRSFLAGVCTTLIFALSFAMQAHAQARPSADKSADVSVFAGLLYLNPDYGPYNNVGEMAGVDFTRYFGHLIVPSLELRGTRASGTGVTERSVVVGAKLAHDLNRFHPYADFLVGGGTIIFVENPLYHEDRSTVYSYGGGVDVDVLRNFRARVDLQATHWDLGIVHPMPFAPTQISVGVVYRIPFGAHRRQADVQ